MISQEKLSQYLAEKLDAGHPMTFGLIRINESNTPILQLERHIYPIIHFQIFLADQNRNILIQEADLPPDYQLMMDRSADKAAQARLALIRKQKGIIAASGDNSPIYGSVFVITSAKKGPNEFPFAVSAVFGIREGHQVSSILCDSSEELISYWAVQNNLFEKGELFCVHNQSQPQAAYYAQYPQPDHPRLIMG